MKYTLNIRNEKEGREYATMAVAGSICVLKKNTISNKQVFLFSVHTQS
jgi:hypothetical protein